MAKLIVKIHHLKSKKSVGGFVNYIANREGVDKTVNQKVLIGKPTKKQIEYIDEMLKYCPDSKNSFEYEDYISNPTKQNASALISVMAESNPDLFDTREMYLNYIATRPNVEKVSEHGLFGSEEMVSLPDVRKEIENAKSVIWTPIISLKREDASRLGYDNADVWRELIRAKQMDMAEVFGIPIDDFKWYGAFHNEGNHPHLHMVVYSTGSKKGYITENKIEKIKSMLANEIFKNEMYELYDNKTKAREKISDTARKKISELADVIKSKDYSDSEVCNMLLDLAVKLKSVKGKKQYGYLPKGIKEDVDEIVKRLASDKDIQKLYDEWCNIQRQIVEIYKDKEIEFSPLWDNKEFKKIKNAVVAEAVKLGDNRVFIESEDETSSDEEDISDVPEQTAPEGDKCKNTQQTALPDADLVLSATRLFCRLANIIENDTDKKIDGFNKTIVDSKERIRIMKKKQSLGIKMG